MQGRALALAALVAVAAACSAERAAVPGSGPPPPPAPAPASSPVSESPTYLALGDSLAAGVGAPAGQGYVDLVHAGIRDELPDLLALGVSGETTSSMLTPGGQLERAEEALRSGEVRLVTIDIGANDGLGCALARDEACVEGTLDAVRVNLATVLERIRTADPEVPVVGADYYLPVPPQLQADPSQVAAALDVLQRLNDTLTDVYGEYRVPVAPVSDAFGGRDPALVVERTCAYTQMCSPAPDIHPNPTGHAAIADALLAVLPDVG